MVSVITSTALVGCERSHRKYVNEWAWLYSIKTLFTDTAISSLCNYHVTKYYSYDYFFQ